MPNGKIGDNPLSDLTIHKLHPFPKDIEEMILRLNELNPNNLNDLGLLPFDWEKGVNLDKAREILRQKLARYE